MSDSHNAQFPETHWSLVLSARDGTLVTSRRALGHLCETYWYPLYAFVRRSGKSPEDAADLTQGVFESLIAHSSLNGVQENRSRFRSFLIGAMKNYMADQHARGMTAKRGGGAPHVPIEVEGAEDWYAKELRDDLTADQLYDRRWALTVLETVFRRLREEYCLRGKAKVFDALKDQLEWNAGGRPYGEIAESLDMSARAVEQAVYRLRRRYRALLEEEIGHTVSSPEDLRSEMEALLGALGS